MLPGINACHAGVDEEVVGLFLLGKQDEVKLLAVPNIFFASILSMRTSVCQECAAF